MQTNVDNDTAALAPVRDQLDAATAAGKCHRCGCFRSTVAALEKTAVGQGDLAATLARARATFVAEEYDCLGCPVCYPALAANALADARPDLVASLAACPTDTPRERPGWPPLAGDYHVVRYRAPVAVCSLDSDELAAALSREAPAGLAIAGTLRTENLGIERIIRNVLANPHIRFLILCGKDAERRVGHLPGQSLASLFERGVDERGRIPGALGKRPVLKNVSRRHIDAFLRHVELVDLRGAGAAERVRREVEACAARDPGAAAIGPIDEQRVAITSAPEPTRLIPDPAGYMIVYPDPARGLLAVEHYRNDGVLDAVVEGRSPAAVSAAAIDKKLVSRLDHAVYLGRELARAEACMRSGDRYVQDRAPGDVADAAPSRDCAAPSCDCAAPSTDATDAAPSRDCAAPSCDCAAPPAEPTGCCSPASPPAARRIAKPKWAGVAFVVAAVAAILIYKGVARGDGSGAARAPASAAPRSPAVVLIADAREADEACGCGRIIRAVRAAAKRGVAVVEGAPGSRTARAYHATVIPTVLFLDARGAVRARYDGESAATVKAIERELSALERTASGRR